MRTSHRVTHTMTSARHRPTPDDSPSRSPSPSPSSTLPKRRRTLPTLLPPISSLVDLTPALLILIAQFIPWRSKLLHLTHLCRRFPPPIPRCFAEDHIPVRPALLRALASSSSPSLFPLLSDVAFSSLSSSLVAPALYGELSDHLAPPLPLPPFSSRPLFSAFSGLQSLVLMLDEPEDADPSDDTPGFYERLFCTLGRTCPRLHSLHFETERKRYPPAICSTVSLSLLREVAQLRTLRLGFLLLEHSAIAMLASLPCISYLDVSGCLILHPGQSPWKESQATQFAPSVTLNSLFIPRHEASNISAVLDVLNRCGEVVRSAKEQKRVGDAGGEGMGGGCVEDEREAKQRGVGLDYLSCDVKHAHLLMPLLSFIPSLMSIDLDGSDAFDLSLLCNDTGSLALPKLIEFRSTSVLPADWSTPADFLTTLSDSYLRFLKAYHAQLRALDMRLPNHSLCLPALQHAFACTQLRLLDLSLCAKDAEPDLVDCSSLTPTRLPHLHTLATNALRTDAQLISFMAAYPAMEDLSLVTSSLPSLPAIMAIGSGCPLVRRVRVCVVEQQPKEEEKEATEQKEAVDHPLSQCSASSTSFMPVECGAPASPPVFPVLSQLSLVGVDKATSVMASAYALSVARMLTLHAPLLRYLRLAIDLTPALLPSLCGVQSLMALKGVSLPALYAPYFVSQQAAAGLQDEWGKAEMVGKFAGFTLGSGVLDASMMAEEQREEFNGALFVTERRFSSGHKDGRAALRDLALLHLQQDGAQPSPSPE